MFLPFRIEPQENREYSQSRAIAVYVLLALFLVVHILVFVVLKSNALRDDVFYRFGVVKYRLFPWALITCTFLHGGWAHLAGNSYFFWVYGSHLERLLGTVRFIVLYLIGALVSIFIHLLTISPFFIDVPTIGASGAIAAVMGAFFVIMPVAKMECLFFSMISFRPVVIRLPAWVVLGMWFVGQLLYSMRMLLDTEQVAFWAHVGGFAAGAVVGTVLLKLKERKIADVEAELRRPLAEGWNAMLRGDSQLAAEKCSQLDPSLHAAGQGTFSLLRGLVGCDDANASAGALLRAFAQSRDYGNYPKALTSYMQLLKCAAPEDIPAAVHRDAGAYAVDLKCPSLALFAYCAALDGGVDEGLDRMLRSIEAILRHKFGDSERADAVRAVIEGPALAAGTDGVPEPPTGDPGLTESPVPEPPE